MARSADPSLPAELGTYAEETKQLVSENFAAIEQVAAALRGRHDLSYEDICALVKPEAATWEYEPNGWLVAGSDEV
jgi:hypothetical protein